MLNHNYIGTEHLLLGLVHEGDGVAAKALESLGISLEVVRQQVEAIIGKGIEPPPGPIPLTPRTKKVLELTLREATELGHSHIGTEHLLLGLIREGEGVAAQVLTHLGADFSRVRLQVIQLLRAYRKEPAAEQADESGSVPSMPERFTVRARRVVVLAQEEARMLNHNYIGTEHLLLGLVHEGEGVAARVLESLGISLVAVRQQVEAIIGQGIQPPPGHIPFTPRAKTVLELSLREALELGHNYIGTAHILLGLIREGEGVAAQVLALQGADLSRVRVQVIRLVDSNERPDQAQPVQSAQPALPVSQTTAEPEPEPEPEPAAARKAVPRRRAEYADFDLAVRSDGLGSFTARVLNSPAGQTGEMPLRLPWSELELENLILKIQHHPRSVRRIDNPHTAAIKDFGSRMYQALFTGQIETVLLRSLSEAAAHGSGLRIRLRLTDAPELGLLPWEFMYDGVRNRFLCLSERTPLIRFLDVPDPLRPLRVAEALRILVVIASPPDFGRLHAEEEWDKISRALDPLIRSGAVEVHRLPQATLDDLRRALRQEEWNVLHFIGHGGFDQSTRDGILIFQDAAGRSRPVSSQDLGILLHDHDPLRLVVLNACEGARSDQQDPFSGTAQGLMQQGVPAAIAMQFEISDKAAITLASELYSAICDGYSLEAAVTAARKAIFTDGNPSEWATPVLYLRAANGNVFHIEPHGG